jgi:hypothetical protein
MIPTRGLRLFWKHASRLIAVAAFAHLASAADAAPSDPSATAPRKPVKARTLAPQCALEARTGCAPGTPKQVPLNRDRGRAEDAGTKWIFQGPPKSGLPFENDLTPKKKPVGGLVGIEFPF